MADVVTKLKNRLCVFKELQARRAKWLGNAPLPFRNGTSDGACRATNEQRTCSRRTKMV